LKEVSIGLFFYLCSDFHFLICSFQDSETRGGDTQLGWVLVSHKVSRNETFMIIRDSYANEFHRANGHLSMEEFLKKLNYPIEFSNLKVLEHNFLDLVKLDDMMVNEIFICNFSKKVLIIIDRLSKIINLVFYFVIKIKQRKMNGLEMPLGVILLRNF